MTGHETKRRPESFEGLCQAKSEVRRLRCGMASLFGASAKESATV